MKKIVLVILALFSLALFIPAAFAADPDALRGSSRR